MTTLPTRLSAHYLRAAQDGQDPEDCTRELLRLLAAELNYASYPDAADWLLGELLAEVIPFRRPDAGGAA